jgi:hypothetical protein
MSIHQTVGITPPTILPHLFVQQSDKGPGSLSVRKIGSCRLAQSHDNTHRQIPNEGVGQWEEGSSVDW